MPRPVTYSKHAASLRTLTLRGMKYLAATPTPGSKHSSGRPLAYRFHICDDELRTLDEVLCLAGLADLYMFFLFVTATHTTSKAYVEAISRRMLP